MSAVKNLELKMVNLPVVLRFDKRAKADGDNKTLQTLADRDAEKLCSHYVSMASDEDVADDSWIKL